MPQCLLLSRWLCLPRGVQVQLSLPSPSPLNSSPHFPSIFPNEPYLDWKSAEQRSLPSSISPLRDWITLSGVVGKQKSFLAKWPKRKRSLWKSQNFGRKKISAERLVLAEMLCFGQNSSFLLILLMLNRTKVEAEVMDQNTFFGRN